MAYLQERTKDIRSLHTVYCIDIPDDILGILMAPELLRLNGISQFSGVELSSFKSIMPKYTKLDHSLGVALILYKYGASKEEILFSLLHDLAVPAFNESTFLLDKNLYTNSISLYDAIVGSDTLFNYFMDQNIDINGLCDFKKSSLVNLLDYKLDANKLEYLLTVAYITKLCDLDEIKELYDDLIVVDNEDFQKEFCFKSSEFAKKFCRISIEIAKKNRSYENKIVKKYISDALERMLKRGEISSDDLQKYTDKAIMEIGKSCSDRRISDMWVDLKKIDRVYTRFNPIESTYCVKVSMEPNYIDPLFKSKFGVRRVSNVYSDSKKDIEVFLNSDTDLFMYF